MAAPVWLAFAIAIRFITSLGAVAGELSWFTVMISFFSLVAGVPVGWTLARGLIDAVHFTGWIPWSIAAAASALIVIVGVVLTGLVVAVASFYVALICTMSTVGAVAAVTRFTWAES